MTGSIALDVVIGLIFIYLLYSLLATVVMEIIATNIGLRARNLRLAIIKMLSDGEIGYWKSFSIIWFTNIFGFINKQSFSDADLTGKFYESPLIAKLNSGGVFSSPSSISKELFAENIIFILTNNNQAGEQEIHTLIATFFNTQAGNDSKLFKHLRYLYQSSNNDIEKFRIKLEEWYEEMMERCTGWYKKRVQVILFFVGFTIAWLFNADTFVMVQKLSVDKDAREKIVQMASSYIENQRYVVLDSTDKIEMEKRLDTLYAIKRNLEEDINAAGSLLGKGSFLPDTIKVDSLGNVKPAWVEKNILEKALCHRSVKKGQTYHLKPKEKRAYFFGLFSHHFWGYLITALAISLGAPFWFDLLSKLMKVRGSLKEPLSSENQQNSSGRQKTAKG